MTSFLVINLLNYPITKKNVAIACKISEVTISKCFKKLNNHKLELLPKKFIETHPYTTQNETDLTKNAKDYILEFKRELNVFVENKKNKIGESKVILANLIGENDDLLGGIDWAGTP